MGPRKGLQRRCEMRRSGIASCFLRSAADQKRRLGEGARSARVLGRNQPIWALPLAIPSGMA
jgi:hypothetical protein